jgi:hypothetical protein
LHKIHTNPSDNLISEEDNQLFIKYLKQKLVELGLEAEEFDSMRHYQKVLLYCALCDCLSSLLLVYSTTRKAETEGLTKKAWKSGIQSEPVNGK